MHAAAPSTTSLGQKRAEAVLRALKVYGVKDTEVEAVSWVKNGPRRTARRYGLGPDRRAD